MGLLEGGGTELSGKKRGQEERDHKERRRGEK